MSFNSGLISGLTSGLKRTFAVEPAPKITTLSITNTPALDPVNSEANVSCAVQVTNTLKADAISVVATIVLDAQLTLVSCTAPTGWTFSTSGQTVTARNSMIPKGLAPLITVVATTPTTTPDISVTVNTSVVAANVVGSQSANISIGVLGILAGVPRDATAKIYHPVTAAHWTTWRSARSVMPNGNPNSGWDFQDTSGAAVDGINGINLSNLGSMLYQQTVSGFTRKGVRGTEATSNQRFINFTTAPNPNTSSILIFNHVKFAAAAPANTRGLFGVASNCEVYWLANGHLRLVLGANTEGSVDYTGTDELLALWSDRTHTLTRLYTTKEIIVGTHVAPASGTNIWNAGQTAPASSSIYMWQVEFKDAAAEFANATTANNEIRKQFQRQGRAVLW